MPATPPPVPPEPIVVHVPAPEPPRKNPWPRALVVCVAMASLTTCMVAAQKPAPKAPACQPAKASHKPARKHVRAAPHGWPVQASTVRPGSVVDLGQHNSGDPHEAVSSLHPRPD